jgi:hypothetical protein
MVILFVSFDIRQMPKDGLCAKIIWRCLSKTVQKDGAGHSEKSANSGAGSLDLDQWQHVDYCEWVDVPIRNIR